MAEPGLESVQWKRLSIRIPASGQPHETQAGVVPTRPPMLGRQRGDSWGKLARLAWQTPCLGTTMHDRFKCQLVGAGDLCSPAAHKLAIQRKLDGLELLALLPAQPTQELSRRHNHVPVLQNAKTN